MHLQIHFHVTPHLGCMAPNQFATGLTVFCLKRELEGGREDEREDRRTGDRGREGGKTGGETGEREWEEGEKAV